MGHCTTMYAMWRRIDRSGWYSVVRPPGSALREVVRVPGVTSVFIAEGERLMLFDDSATKLRFTLDDGVDDPVATQGSRGEWRGLRCVLCQGALGFRIALLTDSWGTYIELTEGRSALD